MVYWTSPTGDGATSSWFDSMTEALAFMQFLRRDSSENKFISMASESADNVGKMGVDSVVDGKCPDGVEYSWVKRRDGGQ